MEWLLPLLFIDRLSGSQRLPIGEQLLPALIPGPVATRVVFAALSAEDQARRQALAGRNIVGEAVRAARIADAEHLKKYPELFKTYQSLPAELQKDIFPVVAANHAPARRHLKAVGGQEAK